MEEFHSITESSLTTCPVCHKETLVRDIGGGAGLVFKGSGFYLTDYKNKSSSSSPAASSKPAAKKDESSAATPPPTKTENPKT
jgi:predicted nucleic acid-binding Zn ribbon protein